MTIAIAGGLLSGGYAAECLCIAEPRADQREKLATILPGVDITASNADIARNVDCLVLATKPQVLADVCRELADAVQQQRPLVVSIAAGVRGADIDGWLGGGLSIVRVMPNQPALLRMGASGLFANELADSDDRALAEAIMAAVGKAIWVATEADIDAVTAVSGSGPAYFFLLIDMLAETAAEMGLDAEAGQQLAVQTALGAATMASQTDASMAELIARVRSPGGTTAAALDSLDAQNVRAIFSAAFTAAKDRAAQLADEAGE